MKKFQNTLVEYVASESRGFARQKLVVDSNFQYYTRYLEPMARAKYNIQIKSGNVFQIRRASGTERHGRIGDGERSQTE